MKSAQIVDVLHRRDPAGYDLEHYTRAVHMSGAVPGSAYRIDPKTGSRVAETAYSAGDGKFSIDMEARRERARKNGKRRKVKL